MPVRENRWYSYGHGSVLYYDDHNQDIDISILYSSSARCYNLGKWGKMCTDLYYFLQLRKNLKVSQNKELKNNGRCLNKTPSKDCGKY